MDQFGLIELRKLISGTCDLSSRVTIW